jgi:integral membrane protein
MFATPRALYKIFALSEGVTWTLLLGALAVRAIFGIPSLLFTIIGGLHGFVFLAYGVSAALVGVNNRWGIGRTVLAIALAVVPFATVPFEMAAERKGRLVGQWRREKTSDVRDNHWFDSLYRWFINRPVILVLTLAVVVVGIFATLLIIGPPGEWSKE